MPIIAIVDGIRIMIFFNDHDPPHVHVECGEHKGRLSIATLRLMDGDLPAGKRRKLEAWAQVHQAELSRAWQDVRGNRKPGRID